MLCTDFRLGFRGNYYDDGLTFPIGRAELDLPTVGQAADDYTANRSNNKNWSIGFRDDCTWQTNEQTERGSDKPAGPRRQLDERDYQPDSKPTKKRPERGGFFI